MGDMTKTFRDEETYNKLKGMDLGDGILTVQTSEDYANSPSKYARNVRNDLRPEFYADSKWKWSVNKVRRDDNNDPVLSIFPSVKLVGMLKHPSQMDPEDPFVDEGDRQLALVFRFKMGRVTEEEMDELHEYVIQDFIEELSHRQEVGKVRWYNCEQKKIDKGACFRL